MNKDADDPATYMRRYHETMKELVGKGTFNCEHVNMDYSQDIRPDGPIWFWCPDCGFSGLIPYSALTELRDE